MDKDHFKAWQYCVNKRFSLEDMSASKWLKEFVYAPSADSLQNAVVKNYSKMAKHKHRQGKI